MKKTNRLSRRLYWKVEVKKDNENQKLIKKEQIWNLVEVVVEEPQVNIVEKQKRLEIKTKK